MPHSQYRTDGVSDYSHRLHAGNVGDVWKHAALVEVLRRAAAGGQRVTYVETHAGEGAYDLGPTGEWSEGIGRLWTTADGDDSLARYVVLCRRLGAGAERPTRYPGSPALARAVLGPDADLALWERDPATCARLAGRLRADAHAEVHEGDGLAALTDELRAAERHADAVVALLDPPWSRKSDWTLVPDTLAHALAGTRRTCAILWYPVKSQTRPNAMLARLEAAGVGGANAELITTPLEHQRNRLNGSGVLLVGPPAGTLEALAALGPAVGARCATRAGAWSFRARAW